MFYPKSGILGLESLHLAWPNKSTKMLFFKLFGGLCYKIKTKSTTDVPSLMSLTRLLGNVVLCQKSLVRCVWLRPWFCFDFSSTLLSIGVEFITIIHFGLLIFIEQVICVGLVCIWWMIHSYMPIINTTNDDDAFNFEY